MLPYIRIAKPDVHQEIKMLSVEFKLSSGVLVSEILLTSLKNGEAEKIAKQVIETNEKKDREITDGSEVGRKVRD